MPLFKRSKYNTIIRIADNVIDLQSITAIGPIRTVQVPDARQQHYVDVHLTGSMLIINFGLKSYTEVKQLYDALIKNFIELE